MFRTNKNIVRHEHTRNMGIQVANLVLQSTGVQLANAYLAFSRNALVVQPTENGYMVRGTYSVWNSEADKGLGRAPLATAYQDTSVVDPAALQMCMASIYASLKTTYPSATDVMEAGQPTPSDPTPSDPVPSDPVPEDPVPSDPVPEDPVPSDPTPEDPVPSDPTPEDPVPSDP